MSDPPRTTQRVGVAAVALAGFALAVVLGLLSEGSLQDDGVAHYLYARWAWHDPLMLWDVWGRPGMTALYAPAARFGWTACRIQSAALSAAAAWLTFLAARRLGLRWPALAPALVLAQPLFLALAYDTFTETSVAFYLALAVWLLACGRNALSAAALSLCFVTRYETAILAAAWAIGFWRVSARWHTFVLLVWAPIAYNLIGRSVLGQWPAQVLLESPHLSEYGAGSPLSMMVKSLIACGPAIGVLALAGTAAEIVKRRTIETSKPLGLRALVGVIALAYLLHLAVQTLLFWRGAFSSGGYARFFVSTAPLAAILTLAALDRLASHHPRRTYGVLWAIVAVAWLGIELEPPPTDEVWLLAYQESRPLLRAFAVIVLAVIALRCALPGRQAWKRGLDALLAFVAVASMIGPWVYLIRPRPLQVEPRDIAAAVTWLRERGLDGAPIITTSVWTAYFLGSESNLTALPGLDPAANAAPGDVLIWDARYSPSERFRLDLERLDSDPKWRLLWSGPQRDLGAAGIPSDPDRAPFVRIYRRE